LGFARPWLELLLELNAGAKSPNWTLPLSWVAGSECKRIGMANFIGFLSLVGTHLLRVMQKHARHKCGCQLANFSVGPPYATLQYSPALLPPITFS
jgi:hypothetical protein